MRRVPAARLEMVQVTRNGLGIPATYRHSFEEVFGTVPMLVVHSHFSE
jgi:hypothetical protein